MLRRLHSPPKQIGPSLPALPCAFLESLEEVQGHESHHVAPADGFIGQSKGPVCCAGIIRRRSKRDLPFLHYPVRPSNHSKRYRVMSPITSPLPTGSFPSAGIIRRRSKRDLPFLHYPVRPSNHSKRYRVMSPITSPLPTGIGQSKGPVCCAGIIRRRSKRDLPFLHYPVRPSNQSKR